MYLYLIIRNNIIYMLNLDEHFEINTFDSLILFPDEE